MLTEVQQQGFVRIGTDPFMALDPLEKPYVDIPRRYCHDLEVFACCLASHCFDEESAWQKGGYKSTCSLKTTFLVGEFESEGRKGDAFVNAVSHSCIISFYRG